MGTDIINDVVLDTAPSCVNTQSGTVLILGGGKCLWEDYLKAKELTNGHHILCVNDIATQFKAEHIHHVASLHKGFFTATRLLREEKGLRHKYSTHCSVGAPDVDFIWRMENVGGTSGLFAVKIALCLGYKKIIVCGVPMDNSGHYFDPLNANDNRTTKFATRNGTIDPWKDLPKSKYARERVRSMSGNTAKILGTPTKEWANGI